MFGVIKRAADSMVVAFGLVFALMVVACNPVDDGAVEQFEEKNPSTIIFTNAIIAYNGDDIGDQLSDGWLLKFYTDMEIDDAGNPIGPGSVMQLLLNVAYSAEQEPLASNLEGSYVAQSGSSDFNPGTFVYGYMNRIDLPGGYIEQPDASFYASIAEGSIEMDIDLLDDGSLKVIANGDGTHTIKGTLVGKQCRKRYFEWRGELNPQSLVPPSVPNSTISNNLQLATLKKAQFQDRGDYFFLKDESYREILIYLVEESFSFDWGNPKGSGDVLRIELLVPWSTDIKSAGIPAGEYTMVARNENGSISRENIVPFRAVAGAPDNFSYPYWAGCWYVGMVDSVWGANYARIDGGSVKVERGEDGSHRFICDLKDCSSPSYTITADVTIAKDNLTIY